MDLERIRTTLTDFSAERGHASVVFTSSEQTGFGVLGIAAAALGQASAASVGVVVRTDTGGVQWQFVYTEGALRRVSPEVRYWPDRQTNPDLVVPNEAGLKEAITQAEAKA